MRWVKLNTHAGPTRPSAVCSGWAIVSNELRPRYSLHSRSKRPTRLARRIGCGPGYRPLASGSTLLRQRQGSQLCYWHPPAPSPQQSSWAYLVYLGFRTIFARTRADRGRSPEAMPAVGSTKQIFWQGFLTNVLNPKVALFFLAFLPQFINSTAESKATAFVFLGLLFDVVGTLWNLLVARTAALFADWAKGSTRAPRLDGSHDWRGVHLSWIPAGYRRAITREIPDSCRRNTVTAIDHLTGHADVDEWD